MANDPVVLERHGHVAIVTIQRGARGNALDGATWDALRRASLALSDAPPRAAIVTGAPNFSSGLDLSADNPIVGRLEALSRGRDTYKIAEYVANLQAAIVSFARVPCPVIAAIEGPCLGAGLELALTADLRVASRDATLGMPEVLRGLTPMNGGLVHLQHLLGPARTAELVLTGHPIDAATALSWGLLNRVTEPGGALAEARTLADELARNSRQAVLQTTLALRQLSGRSTAAYELETQAAARTVSAGDLTEGIQAFLQKRPARMTR